MLMKLRLVLSQDVVKKLIVILLAILIATITTSFSFSLRKAYGNEGEGIVKDLKAQKDSYNYILTVLNDMNLNDSDEVMDTLEVLRSTRGADVLDIITAYRDKHIGTGKNLFREYRIKISEKVEDLDQKIKSRESTNESEKTDESVSASCTLATELEAKVADLNEKVKVLEEKEAEQDEEIASMKSDIIAVKEENAANKEKLASMEMEWFRTTVRLQARIFMTPDQVHAVYQGALEKHAKFGEIGLKIKYKMQEIDDTIDELQEKADKGKLSDADEKILKEKKAEKDEVSSIVNKLGKEFAMNEEVLKIFTEDGLIDEQGNFRGTRVTQGQPVPGPASTVPQGPVQQQIPGTTQGQVQPTVVPNQQVNTTLPVNPNQLAPINDALKNFIVYSLMNPRNTQQGWGQRQNPWVQQTPWNNGQGQVQGPQGPIVPFQPGRGTR